MLHSTAGLPNRPHFSFPNLPLFEARFCCSREGWGKKRFFFFVFRYSFFLFSALPPQMGHNDLFRGNPEDSYPSLRLAFLSCILIGRVFISLLSSQQRGTPLLILEDLRYKKIQAKCWRLDMWKAKICIAFSSTLQCPTFFLRHIVLF